MAVFADTVSGFSSSMELELAILSRQGGRDYNEDACGHWHSGSHLCCVVADGAGGHGGGDIASRLAVQHIIQSYAAAPARTPEEVREIVIDSNRAVLHHRGDGERQQNMHSTVVALFIDLDAGSAMWGHAGDSRLYVLRQGRIASQTRDHSLMQQLVDAGMLRPDQVRSHPQRSELLSALGTSEEELMVSVCDAPLPLQHGDVLLLCTDGLWEYVEDPQLEASLTRAADPNAWLAELETMVLANAVHKPRHDNFSALTVWVRDGRTAAA